MHQQAGLVALTIGLAAAGVLVLASPASALYEEQFTWPMDGEVTSTYWDCRDNCDRYHRGIDIANGCDTPIYAVRGGTANTYYDANGYGNYVIVTHNDGVDTLYAHMDSTSVDDGESVDRGDLLGYEGDTGASTGCHVHFEVRQDHNGFEKNFLHAHDGDRITEGDFVGFDVRAFEVDQQTEVLDGPNIGDVPDQGDEQIGTADAGDIYIAYEHWTNDAGEKWYVTSFDGRAGWIQATDVTETDATATRIDVDTVLNVRSGAGTSNDDIGDVYGTQEYHVLDTQEDADGDAWFQIPYHASGRDTGWIHGGYAHTVAYGVDGPMTGYEILVDPGHGGDDSGATSEGVEEADVNLDISTKLKDKLVADGADVVMTRSTDETVSLSERTDAANEYDVDRFVSVHANSCGDCGASGTETYYHDSLDSTSTAADMAENVQTHVLQEAGTDDRGVKQDNFHVLRESDMPANVVETAFIDDDGNREKLTSDSGQHDFARGILDGVEDHLGVLDDGDDGDDGNDGPLTTLDDSFESDRDGWTVTDDSGAETWQRTTDRASDGSYSVAIDNYASDEGDEFTSPRVDLSGYDNADLSVDSWMQGERACGVFSCTIYDYGTIEISDDGGDSWTTLETDYWDSEGWETLTYDLDAYVGETVQIRFTFTSDGASQNEGWYVDDVEINEGTPAFATGFDDGLGNFQVNDNSGSETWQATTDRASEGTQSAAINNYDSDEDDELVSPTIDLSDRSSATLTLDSWMEGEEYCGVFGCTIYDYGTIEISDDGGDSWRTLETDYWSSDGWETLEYDVSEEAGSSDVQLRFTFVSDGSVQNEGWYVDDIQVE